jgi:hypothetical protein
VEFLDELIASGAEASRASIVTRALIREKRWVGALPGGDILERLRPADKELEPLAP